MGNPHILDKVDRPTAPLLPSPAEQQRGARLARGRVVIVCGGRDYQDEAAVFAALYRAHAKEPITLLVHGACMDPTTGELLGADRWADRWARGLGIEVEPHPADWGTWGKAACAMRDRQMAEAGAHSCIAFPGGSGTASVVRQAEAHGIPVSRPTARTLIPRARQADSGGVHQVDAFGELDELTRVAERSRASSRDLAGRTAALIAESRLILAKIYLNRCQSPLVYGGRGKSLVIKP